MASLRFKYLQQFLIWITYFLKLYPYIIFLALWNYCVVALTSSDDIIVKISALINLFFQAFFILLHEFINESLKFREIDYCNRRIVSYTGSLFQAGAIVALYVFGIFYALIFYYVIAIYELFVIFKQF